MNTTSDSDEEKTCKTCIYSCGEPHCMFAGEITENYVCEYWKSNKSGE